MPNYRVSLGFAQDSDAELGDCFHTIEAGLDGNAAFPNLPVTHAALVTLGTTFIEKLAASADGGKLAVAEKNVARATLVEALRKEAAYVQSVAGTDLPKLLSSGFAAVNNNTAQTPLPKPVVDNIDDFQSTKLMLRLKPIPNLRAVEARRKQGAADWEDAGIFTQTRKIVQEDLTPGATYSFQFRAIGGSTGYSEWSDPISHMAT
jgi:hypothetical protein